jgi:hypothetical protein
LAGASSTSIFGTLAAPIAGKLIANSSRVSCLTRIVPLLASSLFLLSCSTSGSDPGSTSGPGGKVDDIAAEPAEEFSCAVVSVNEKHNFLEEGFGSIYDIDDEGFPGMDEDSIEVSWRRSDMSEHDSGFLLSVGQLTVGLHSANDELRTLVVERDSDDDPEIVAIEGRREESNNIVKVKLFTVNMLGAVYVRPTEDAKPACIERKAEDCLETCDPEFDCEFCEEDAEFDCGEKRLAVLDCRGIPLPTLDF